AISGHVSATSTHRMGTFLWRAKTAGRHPCSPVSSTLAPRSSGRSSSRPRRSRRSTSRWGALHPGLIRVSEPAFRRRSPSCSDHPALVAWLPPWALQVGRSDPDSGASETGRISASTAGGGTMQLKGQTRKLHEAIVGHFGLSDLKQLALLDLGEPLGNITADG